MTRSSVSRGARKRAILTTETLARELADRAEITLSSAREEVRWFFDTLAASLEKGDEIRIRGFGTFTTAHRAARMGRLPRTGQPTAVPARTVVRFSASRSLTSAVGGPDDDDEWYFTTRQPEK